MRNTRATFTGAAVVGAAALLAVSGCAVGGQTQQGAPAPVPEVVATGGAGVAADTGAGAKDAAPAATATAPTIVAAPRALIRNSSALLAVDDLDASHVALVTLVRSSGGTVMSEYVASGQEPAPRPRVTSSSPGSPSGTTAEDAAPVPDWYWDRYSRFVDVSFTLPAPRYDTALDRVRSLGRVVHLQQQVDDVTAQVADVGARIASARASVARVQALLTRATTIPQVLQIEQELASRQAALESLEAQQRALAGQVAQSTVTVRLVPVDAVVTPSTSDPSWWNDVVTAVGKAWQGLAFVVAVTSPVWVIGLLVLLLGWLLWRRHLRRRTGQRGEVTTLPGTIRPEPAVPGTVGQEGSAPANVGATDDRQSR